MKPRLLAYPPPVLRCPDCSKVIGTLTVWPEPGDEALLDGYFAHRRACAEEQIALARARACRGWAQNILAETRNPASE